LAGSKQRVDEGEKTIGDPEDTRHKIQGNTKEQGERLKSESFVGTVRGKNGYQWFFNPLPRNRQHEGFRHQTISDGRVRRSDSADPREIICRNYRCSIGVRCGRERISDRLFLRRSYDRSVPAVEEIPDVRVAEIRIGIRFRACFFLCNFFFPKEKVAPIAVRCSP
jgi:hypothetical protein